MISGTVDAISELIRRAPQVKIILWPDNISFKCFSSNCSHYSFVDLLRLLQRETCQWPETPIWHDHLEKLEARWGCPIDDLSPTADPKPDPSHHDPERTKAEYAKYTSLEDQRIQQEKPDEQRGFRERVNAVWVAGAGLALYGPRK
jgi:hypothetical protein